MIPVLWKHDLKAVTLGLPPYIDEYSYRYYLFKMSLYLTMVSQYLIRNRWYTIQLFQKADSSSFQQPNCACKSCYPSMGIIGVSLFRLGSSFEATWHKCVLIDLPHLMQGENHLIQILAFWIFRCSARIYRYLNVMLFFLSMMIIHWSNFRWVIPQEIQLAMKTS